MFDLTNFTPWTLFSDAGLICALLLVGKFLRVKIRLIQKLFIPPSLLAGILGLALGPNGLGWLPLSGNIGTYAAILIAVVFGALPLSSPSFKVKEVARRVGPMWAFSQLGMLFQWAVMGLFGLLVLKLIWPGLSDAFGVMLPTGFYGGHGTAAAIGSAFEGLGWDEATSLGMTTATIGVIVAILGGLLFIKIATKKGQTSYIADFNQLPAEYRSGLLPEEKREPTAIGTTSPISIDSHDFHLALVIVAAFGLATLRREPKRWWLLLAAIGLCFLLADRGSVMLFKDTVCRLRPCHALENVHMFREGCGGQYGFISSHAANAFAIAMLFFLRYRRRRCAGLPPRLRTCCI